MTESDAIKNLIKVAKEKVALSESLIRLKSNRDFKKVFLDYYGKEFASNLVRNKAHLDLQNEGGIGYTAAQMDAISHMFQFMEFTLVKGETASEDIREHEATLEAIRMEEI